MKIIINLVWNPYLSLIGLLINSRLIDEFNNLFSKGLSFFISLLFSPNQVFVGVHLHLEFGDWNNKKTLVVSLKKEVTNIRDYNSSYKLRSSMYRYLFGLQFYSFLKLSLFLHSRPCVPSAIRSFLFRSCAQLSSMSIGFEFRDSVSVFLQSDVIILGLGLFI